jgi:hypothetical protein
VVNTRWSNWAVNSKARSVVPGVDCAVVTEAEAVGVCAEQRMGLDTAKPTTIILTNIREQDLSINDILPGYASQQALFVIECSDGSGGVFARTSDF